MSNYTYDEIRSQSNALKKTLEIMRKKDIKTSEDQIYLFTGCGTSYYLAIAAARYFQAVTKKQAQAIPASEIFMNPDQVLIPGQSYMIIAISRSGTTTEIISALKFLDGQPLVSRLAITCEADAEMAKIADDSISLDHINEKSVVMTQSFSSMYYALQLFAAKTANDDSVLDELNKIPALAESIFEQSDVMKKVADNLDYQRFIFLGSGLYNGIACEGTLKLKEMTQTECESYSKLEFRHGPISIVDSNTVVVIFTEEKTRDLDDSLSKDIQNLGGHTFVMGNHAASNMGNEAVALETNLSDYSSSVLLMPFVQMLAYYRAVKLGLNPDQPRNLNQVVKISLPF